MKNSQRFLIAKYASDVRRMEPRNIGVVLWASGQVAGKFLDPAEADFVTDKETYKRWVAYWQRLLSEPTITPIRGAAVPRTSPEFLEEFSKTQKDNYMLLESGFVTDKVPARQVNAAVKHLFEQLVARKGHWPADPKENAARLRAVSDQMFQEAGLAGREDFKKSYVVQCPVGSVTKPFHLSYAIGNGVPESAYQRVQLAAQQSVHSAAFMFERMAAANILAKERCAAIVHADEAALQNAETESSLKMLEEFAAVVNLADYITAIQRAVAVAQGRRP